MAASWFVFVAFGVACSSAVDLSSITFPYKPHNFEEKAFTNVSATHNGEVCTAGEITVNVGETFTTEETGPCIQFDCTAEGVKLNTEQSGCENGNKCQKGDFDIMGCTSVSCQITDDSTNGSISLKRHLKLMSEKKCKLYGDCYPIGEDVTFPSGDYFMRCVCHGLDMISCIM